MYYYEDMSSYSYFLKTELPKVKNIGWLDPAHKFLQGNVEEGLLVKLKQIILGGEKIKTCFHEFRNIRRCELCRREEITLEDHPEFMLGKSEFWIPSMNDGEYFAAPTLIYHYMRDHNYMPPSPFLDSVKKFSLREEFHAGDIYLELTKGMEFGA